MAKQVSVKALDDISFQIHRGEIFGLVGESGSGKSTAARCAMGILQPSGGHIFYNGVDLCDKAACRANKKMLQTTRQMIFQDSASSLDPHMTVCDSITEPMRIHHIAPPRGTYRKEAEFQMYYVGLDKTYLDKYPSELSGGQRPARRHRAGAVHGAGAFGGGRAGRAAGCLDSGADRQPVSPFAA